MTLSEDRLAEIENLQPGWSLSLVEASMIARAVAELRASQQREARLREALDRGVAATRALSDRGNTP